MLWRKLEKHEQGMWCATAECWGIPTQYMEADGGDVLMAGRDHGRLS